MAVTDHSSQVRTSNKFADIGRSGRRLAWVLRASWSGLAAGWRAAADYRQLSEMSDRQLRLRGLSRCDIPRTLHERHFASLGGWLDNVD